MLALTLTLNKKNSFEIPFKQIIIRFQLMGTWALGYLITRRILRHSSTQALGHSKHFIQQILQEIVSVEFHLIVRFNSHLRNILGKFTKSSKIGRFMETFIVFFLNVLRQISKFLLLVGWKLVFNSEYFRSFFEIVLSCLIILAANYTLFFLSAKANNSCC